MATFAGIQAAEVRKQTLWFSISVILTAFASIVSLFALLVAIGTGRRQLRAYLTVEPMGVHEGKSRRNPSPVSQIKNWGQTPAYEVSATTGCATVDWPIVADLDEMFAGLPEGPRDAILAPSQITTVYSYFDHELTKQEFGEIADSTKCLMVFGLVEYRDVFRRKRMTSFCHYYRGEHLAPEFGRFHSAWNFAS